VKIWNIKKELEIFDLLDYHHKKNLYS